MYFFQFAQINKRTKIVSRSQHTKTFSIKILAQKANQTKANQAKSKAVRSTENVSHIEFEYFEHSIISFPSPWHSDFDSDSDSPALDSIPFFAKICFVCCILLYFKCSCVPVLAANIYGPVNWICIALNDFWPAEHDFLSLACDLLFQYLVEIFQLVKMFYCRFDVAQTGQNSQ